MKIRITGDAEAIIAKLITAAKQLRDGGEATLRFMPDNSSDHTLRLTFEDGEGDPAWEAE